ncbi:MAG: ribonuclease III [Nitrospiraceae bacterium]|nr:ribonuclease III [Nitrospiraceae bacterium]
MTAPKPNPEKEKEKEKKLFDPAEKLGHVFRNEELLRQALTHRSYCGDKKGGIRAHNERLEYLGDAVVELVFSEYLYHTGLDEAQMSRIRSQMVRGQELAKAADGLGLGSYLLLGKGEAGTGGSTKQSILAGAFEAMIGAIYLDGGYEAAKKAVIGIFREKLEAIIESGESRDPKTELQELCQKVMGSLPVYKLLKEEGREHEKLFTAGVYISGKSYGRGEGRTKKEAQSRAAREALEKLKLEEKEGDV